MTTKKPKPKRQWERWALIDPMDALHSIYHTKKTALYIGSFQSEPIRLSDGWKIKKVLVIEK